MDVFRLIAEHGDHEVAVIDKKAEQFGDLPAHLARRRDALVQMTAIAKRLVPNVGVIQPDSTASVIDLIRYVAEHGHLETEALAAKIEHLGASATARARAEALEQLIAIAAPLCQNRGILLSTRPRATAYRRSTLASGLTR